jgi:hypothetical protein
VYLLLFSDRLFVFVFFNPSSSQTRSLYIYKEGNFNSHSVAIAVVAFDLCIHRQRSQDASFRSLSLFLFFPTVSAVTSTTVSPQVMRHVRLCLQCRSQTAGLGALFPVFMVDRLRFFTAPPCHGNGRCTPVAARVTLRTSFRFHSSETRQYSSSPSSTSEPELISLDCIEVISTTVHTSSSHTPSTTAATSVSCSSSSATAAATSQCMSLTFTVQEVHDSEPLTVSSFNPKGGGGAPPPTTGLYCDVHNVDPFARGRVVNFIRRVSRVEGDLFRVKEVQQPGTDPTTGQPLPPVYVATCTVPLPAPHGSHVAEGLAGDRKEAEMVAAMHAERVCDALGVPLFRLKTAQQKHAETVRMKEGRYAPLPGDPVKPLGTPVPPPLRLLRSQPSPAASSPSLPSLLCSDNNKVFTACGQSAATSDSHPGVVAGNTERAAKAASNTGAGTTSLRDATQDNTTGSTAHKKAACAAVPPANVPANGDAESTEDSVDDLAPQCVSRGESVAARKVAKGNTAGKKTWPTTRITTPFISRCPSLNEPRRHDPRRLYKAYAPQFTDAEHAERVRSYASTVVYPWQNGWMGVEDVQEDAAAAAATAMGGGDVAVSIATAAAAAAVLATVNYDPTENGLWQMVNDRNLRRSPTPADALVLPYVFDGPHALARVAEYYTQHGTTLEQYLKVRSTPTPGAATRMVEAELRLIGTTVTAHGKSQTEETAIRLAAMHAELLLDALGLPLFPKDAARQARHAEAVAGYGRWATNPLTGSTTVPNPHDPLPRPLKSQVGTDEARLAPDAPPQVRRHHSENERIIAAHNFITARAEYGIEVNPPAELLEEAYVMLREWQTHIAKSRYTNLYVLFDMESNVFRATTITPVPARFGLRGGSAIAISHEKAVRLCALNAMDTLCALNVPLCVDAEQQRRYLQRRAALGQVLPHSLAGQTQWVTSMVQLQSYPHRSECASTLSGAAGDVIRSPAGNVGEGGAAAMSSAAAVPYLPNYTMEGQQTRLPPMFADTMHAMQLRLPQDFCLFSGESDAVLTSIGNEAKICVRNYIEFCLDARIRRITELASTMQLHKPKYPPQGVASVQQTSWSSGGGAAALGKRMLAEDDDDMLTTHLWSLRYLKNAPPFVFVTGYSSQVSVHAVAYLQVPLPDLASPSNMPEKEKTKKGNAQQAPMQTAEAATTAPASAPPTSKDCLFDFPAYVIAAGMSLKRKDAVRSCYIHAASLLFELGVDVLAQFPQGTPRTRLAPTFAALSKYLGTEEVAIIPPFTADGKRNTAPLPRTVESHGGASTARGAPRAVLNNIMKTFLEDPRHVHVRPRRRTPPPVGSPFMPGQRVRH